MFYCDSNLFICALSAGAKAEAATKILKALSKGEIWGMTCSLTVGEVLWVVWKKANMEEAIKAAKIMFTFPNLSIVDTTASDVKRAIGLIRKYGLTPRDAIHAACSLNHAIFPIISDDPDFDVVKELKRLSFEDMVFTMKR